jgi:hypothetical protein
MKHSKITGVDTLNRAQPSASELWLSHRNKTLALHDKSRAVHWPTSQQMIHQFRKILLIAAIVPVISIFGTLCWLYLWGIPTVIKWNHD